MRDIDHDSGVAGQLEAPVGEESNNADFAKSFTMTPENRVEEVLEILDREGIRDEYTTGSFTKLARLSDGMRKRASEVVVKQALMSEDAKKRLGAILDAPSAPLSKSGDAAPNRKNKLPLARVSGDNGCDPQHGRELKFLPDGTVDEKWFAIDPDDTTVLRGRTTPTKEDVLQVENCAYGYANPEENIVQRGVDHKLDIPHRCNNNILKTFTNTRMRLVGIIALATAIGTVGAINMKSSGKSFSSFSNKLVFDMADSMHHNRNELLKFMDRQNFSDVGYQVGVIQEEDGETIDLRPVVKNNNGDIAVNLPEALNRMCDAVRDWRMSDAENNTTKVIQLSLTVPIMSRVDIAAFYKTLSSVLHELPETRVSSLSLYGANQQDKPPIAIDDIAKTLNTRAVDLKNLTLAHVTLENLALPPSLSNLRRMRVTDSHIIKSEQPKTTQLTGLDLTSSSGNGLQTLNIHTLRNNGNVRLRYLIQPDGSLETSQTTIK